MRSDQRKILLCAAACSPRAGSEAGLGWAAYLALRKKNHVKVITSGWSQPAIAEAAGQGRGDLNDFKFIPEKHPMTGVPKIDRWLSWKNFRSFQRNLEFVGRKEVQEFGPDIIHQTTIATWRFGNPLAGIGRPFVWGPIGGGETLPPAFLGDFSPYSRLFETLRFVSSAFFQYAPSVRKTARCADWIFASNRETMNWVVRIRGHRSGVAILPVAFFPEDKMRKFSEPPIRDSSPSRTVRIFSGGYVEARKGIHLALQALARLKRRGLSFQYENSGIGPERKRLEAQIQNLGLAECARFVAAYPGDSYHEKLRATDIFLFPSLRDNCPATLLEAMGHGCVPVVADHAGPGEIVTPDCGIKIPVTRPAEFVDRLTEELAKLFEDEARRRCLGEASRLRALRNFSEENWLSRVESVYAEILSSPRVSAPGIVATAGSPP